MDWNRRVDLASYTASDMPEYPARTLIVHCAMKGLQFGSTLGLIVTPMYSIIKKTPMLTTWRYAMPIGSGVGTSISLGLLYFKYYQGGLDIAGVDDRAYRISKNEGQVHVDNASFMGGVLGSAIFAVGTRQASHVIPGMLTGISAGLLYHVSKPIVNKLIEGNLPSDKDKKS
jgi:hypothetical protein